MTRVLYTFLSCLFIFLAVAFEWLINRTYSQEYNIIYKNNLKAGEKLDSIRSVFTWKRRLFSVFMIGCIIGALSFLIRIF